MYIKGRQMVNLIKQLYSMLVDVRENRKKECQNNLLV